MEDFYTRDLHTKGTIFTIVTYINYKISCIALKVYIYDNIIEFRKVKTKK